MNKKKSLKLVVVGDGSCGKTSLIVAYASGNFNDQYVPTAFDDFSVGAQVNGKDTVLLISDTAGEDDFSAMRPLSYPDADVFLLCYSVESAESLANIEKKWLPEIRQYCPSVPVLVVGNKCDVRGLRGDCVPPGQARDLARRVSHTGDLECSAKRNENVKAVFEQAIKAALAYRNRRANRVIQSIMKLRVVF